MAGPTSVTHEGGPVLIRPVVSRDADGLLELERAVVAAGQGVVKVLADLPTHVRETQPQVDAWVHRDPSEGTRLVAVLDGQVVGEGTAERLAPTLVNHVAVLALQVHPEAQGQGLGRLVLEGLLAWAGDAAGPRLPAITRLELYVRADNHRARKLYESVGFQLEGVRRGFARDVDGTLHDDCVMGLLLA